MGRLGLGDVGVICLCKHLQRVHDPEHSHLGGLCHDVMALVRRIAGTMQNMKSRVSLPDLIIATPQNILDKMLTQGWIDDSMHSVHQQFGGGVTLRSKP